MDYFKKTKFRETSLIFVGIFIAIIYFTISDSPEEDELDVQALIDAAVEEAVEDALSTNSYSPTTSTLPSPDALQIPFGSYWGQYSDGTWALAVVSEKPDNFEWAWDIFNKEDPSGAYGYDEFDENSTLIGTLVDFDCSFNRISKTEEHKEAFGVFETTIEYYDTYFDWAEDNYDYLTEEAVITISKIMRGVWTCDYEYLESISTEYLDFVHSGDGYVELPKFSDYIAKYENNYDDDHYWGKYTYTLGALLYMTPGEENLSFGPEYIATLCPPNNDPPVLVGKSPGFIWPMESMNPKQLRETQVTKMSMFDNGVTQSLIDGTYQGDDGTYGFRLKISSDGIWYSYKYTGHPWRSDYAAQIPDERCPEPAESPVSEGNSTDVQELPDSAIPLRRIEGEISTFGESYDQARGSLIRGVRIRSFSSSGSKNYDSFTIALEKNSKNDLLPGPYMVKKGGNPCITDEGGCKVPDDFEEYLWIRGSFYGRDWTAPDLITNEDSKLVGKFYGTFEGESDFLLKIEPGATFRSYRWDNLIVIEVEKITSPNFKIIKKNLPAQIFRGYVEKVRPIADTGKYEILLDDEIYAGITSSTEIYVNGIKVDKYDFRADKSEYVHAVFNEPVLESFPAQGTASAIYIKKIGNTSGFVNSARLNDIEYHQNDRVRTILVDEGMYVSITENTEIYLNGIKVDAYNFKSEKSEYVYVEHGVVLMSYPGQTTADAIYIVND